MNSEQQQSLLVVTNATKQSIGQVWWQPMSCTARTKYVLVGLLLLLAIGGIAVAYIPKYKSNEGGETVVQKQGYIRQKFDSPEAIGHMSIYVSKSVKDDGRRPFFERVRFPVARYNRRQSPLKGPFINFMPWIPIVADRVTRQTIIYSSIGIYILPPLVNTYGKLYSVAELIASGYASLVSSGVQPTGSIDMRSVFESTPIVGPGIPLISTSTGSFLGGLRTSFGFFNIRDRPVQFRNNRDSEDDNDDDDDDDDDQDKKSYHPTPLMHNKYDRQRLHYSEQSSSPHEVHETLIIDTTYPYSTSRKPIISANYSFPGPLLEAYEGDTFVIRVVNRLDVPSTLHWHGIRQLGTPDMDGAVGVTQCAIAPKQEMIYRFKAEPAGTLWYHGHLLEQYTDGLYGPLIVRRRNESNQQLYDNEQILMIGDWYNSRAHTRLLPWYLNPNNPQGNEPPPDAIVVNGKFTQSLFISLSGLTRVRFRIVNAAALSMYTISIDGLPLHIIEVDSTTTFPYTVNSFDINVAQRVSFYIDLSELSANYTATGTSPTSSVFFRIQAVVSMYSVDIVNYIPPYEHQRYPYPTFFNPLYLAILSFVSTNSMPAYAASSQTPTLSNVVTPPDTNLLDARPFDRNIGGIPTATHSLSLLIVFALAADGINYPFLNNVTYSSDANYMHMRPDPKTGITSDTYAPLLHQMFKKSQYLGIPSPVFEAGNQLPTIQSDKNGHYLVPYQAVVDIFLNNTDTGEHPFHLHGHNFWIIATSDNPQAEALYTGDYLQRDTVSVPALGWAKIRFVANNPGAWFFHCHIEWHMSAGLALAFLVSPQQLLADGYTVPLSQKHLCQELQKFNQKYNRKPNY